MSDRRALTVQVEQLAEGDATDCRAASAAFPSTPHDSGRSPAAVRGRGERSGNRLITRPALRQIRCAPTGGTGSPSTASAPSSSAGAAARTCGRVIASTTV